MHYKKKEAEMRSASFFYGLEYKCFSEKRLTEFGDEFHKGIDITGVLDVLRD